MWAWDTEDWSNCDMNTGQIYVCVQDGKQFGVCLLKPLEEAPKCLAPSQILDDLLIIERDFWCSCQFVIIERNAFRYAVKSAAYAEEKNTNSNDLSSGCY